MIDCRDFVLDREHVIGHKEAKINATRCPGEYQMSHLDWVVEEAKKIAGEGPVVIEPTPEKITVDRAWLENLMENQLSDAEAIKAELVK